jgi:hypothetical protein
MTCILVNLSSHVHVLFQIGVPPACSEYTCIYQEKVTQHSCQGRVGSRNTIRVMCLTHLHVETAPSNQLGNPLNHTAQTSRLRPQRRGSLLLRQPSKQASKSRLPPLKHSLESRASKPVQRSQPNIIQQVNKQTKHNKYRLHRQNTIQEPLWPSKEQFPCRRDYNSKVPAALRSCRLLFFFCALSATFSLHMDLSRSVLRLPNSHGPSSPVSDDLVAQSWRAPSVLAHAPS